MQGSVLNALKYQELIPDPLFHGISAWTVRAFFLQVSHCFSKVALLQMPAL